MVGSRVGSRVGSTLLARLGTVSVVLGFASYAVSQAFDGGVLRGFFQGATLALMVTGAIALGRSMRSQGGTTGDADAGWLPSRDGQEP